LENFGLEVVLVGARPVEQAQALGGDRGSDQSLRREPAIAGRERQNADKRAANRLFRLQKVSPLPFKL
jgi:hypothetical protein